jgi:hypothetical protein
MNVLELLRDNKPSLEQAQSTVDRLREQAIHAASELQQAEAELADVLVAQQEGLCDGPTITKTRKRVSEARQLLQETEIALAGAERRVDVAEGENAVQELAKRRKQIKGLCDHRHKLALRFQKLAVELAVVVDQIGDVTSDIYSLLPGKTDLTAALLGQSDLYAAMKEQLQRAQATPWSPSPLGQWEVERRPDLVARVEAANVVLGV